MEVAAELALVLEVEVLPSGFASTIPCVPL